MRAQNTAEGLADHDVLCVIVQKKKDHTQCAHTPTHPRQSKVKPDNYKTEHKEAKFAEAKLGSDVFHYIIIL